MILELRSEKPFRPNDRKKDSHYRIHTHCDRCSTLDFKFQKSTTTRIASVWTWVICLQDRRDSSTHVQFARAKTRIEDRLFHLQHFYKNEYSKNATQCCELLINSRRTSTSLTLSLASGLCFRSRSDANLSCPTRMLGSYTGIIDSTRPKILERDFKNVERNNETLLPTIEF